MIDDYVARKHGRRKVEYMVPALEPILKETYGVIVYQEQVMKIASVLANYKMSEADDLRKAMGKKIPEIMARHRERFATGAVQNSIKEKKARNLFDLIEKFGGYGFNKSHSAAYALIAYQTAYLKTHFPVPFLAALLTSEMHAIDGVVKFIAECRSHDIEVLPPDINASDKTFSVDDDRIRFGLVAVKNVGENAIDAIIEARGEGRYQSLFDFCERVDFKRVNKRVIESLVKCGAFDTTGDRRSQMMAALETAIEYGQRIQKERNDQQICLFGDSGSQLSLNVPELPDVEEWDEKQLLAFEKESLGFYLSGHPLNRYGEVLDKYASVNAVTIKDSDDGAVVRMGGLVRSTKAITTKRGDLMSFVSLEDMHGSIEVTVFSRLHAQVSDLLVEDAPVLIQGQVQKDEQSIKLVADTIIPVDRADETWTASIHFNLEVARTDRETLERLHRVFERHPGGSQGYLHLVNPDNTDVVIGLPQHLNLKVGSGLRREVADLLGYAAAETQCTPASANPSVVRENGWRRKGPRSNGRFQR
jgi:DNA polymerase-3 subunit alpha